jgi:outer membrane protein TolC
MSTISYEATNLDAHEADRYPVAFGRAVDNHVTSAESGSPLATYSQTTLSESLHSYISFALQNSAELRAAYDRYYAALQKAPQVSALPDPKLSYGYFIRSVETRVGPQRHRTGISQSLPWFGTLSLKGSQATASAKAELYRFLTKKNKLVFELSKTYAEIAYLYSAIEIMKSNIDLVNSWDEILHERYRSNVGAHSDLVRTQVELGKLEDRLAEVRDMLLPTKVAFNALLNRQAGEAISLDSTLLADASGREAAALARAISDQMISSSNPELLMHDALIEAGNHGIQLARKKYYPDLTLGLDYVATGDRDGASDGGKDALMTVVSLSLPLNWDKYDAGFNEASLNRKSLEAIKKNRLYTLQAEFARAQFTLRDSERRIALYNETLIPKVEEAITTSFTAYQNGQAPFLGILDAERDLLDFGLLLSRARADRLIAIATLHQLSGGYSDMISFDKEN